MYDVMVIGNGLIGSAAARYLSQWSGAVAGSVAVVGPSEPENYSDHTGVFSSHYDQGRLVSPVSQDPIWSVLAAETVSNLPMLQRESGVRVHGPVGRIHATKRTSEAQRTFLEWREVVTEAGDVESEYFESEDRSWKERFPYLDFPSGYAVYYEHGPSGYLNPRQLVAAQNAIAIDDGAEVMDQQVSAVESTVEGVTVHTLDGTTYRAERALIACGAFTNFNRLLPEALPLRLKTESIVLGTVTPQTAARLEAMPCLGYDIEAPDIDDIYMAPPLQYPDGRYRIKMGCNTANEYWPVSLQEVQAWFREGPGDLDLPAMERALRAILPDVDFTEVVSHRCIITYTPSGYPTIDHAPGDPHGRLFVATGGNGSGATASDALGHLAAGLLFDGWWSDRVPRQVFLATNRWGASSKKLTKAQRRASGLS